MPKSPASRTDCVSAGRKAEHSGDITAVLCFTAGADSQCREADGGGRDRHRNLWSQYGSVYTLYFGSRRVVVLCGYEAMKEALIDQGEVFGARGSLPILDNFFQGYGPEGEFRGFRVSADPDPDPDPDFFIGSADFTRPDF
ncbi:unnamed protein product [Ranitomeya imitator]|uniref:Uncharacterized protein n=1 Tax=Ranitomeya imitator TaxID=111125 RepID=A0ABN9LF06_9NEOB|nr:unnamed protein product [Ranitomeya imitator]